LEETDRKTGLPRQKLGVCTMFASRDETTELGCLCLIENGGGRGIRTPESLSTLTVFKTGAFNRSAIPPSSILPDSIMLRGGVTMPLLAFWPF
jgi:hypothetical protein